MSLIKKIDNKIDNGDVVTIVTKDYYLITKEELEEIKQYLEVLEIIRKKRVDVLGLLYEIRQWEEYGDEHILKSYNGRYNNKLYELTMEELLKLKQWLEENEE